MTPDEREALANAVAFALALGPIPECNCSACPTVRNLLSAHIRALRDGRVTITPETPDAR